MSKEFKVEVIETIKRIADDKSPFSIDVLKWGDGKPKLNIRRMYKDKETGKFKFGKGIALTDEEVITVYGALEEYVEKKEL